MGNEEVLKLIEALGDDAKTAFIAYLVIDYGSLWIFFALVTWGVRAFWKAHKKDVLGL